MFYPSVILGEQRFECLMKVPSPQGYVGHFCSLGVLPAQTGAQGLEYTASSILSQMKGVIGNLRLDACPELSIHTPSKFHPA